MPCPPHPPRRCPPTVHLSSGRPGHRNSTAKMELRPPLPPDAPHHWAFVSRREDHSWMPLEAGCAAGLGPGCTPPLSVWGTRMTRLPSGGLSFPVRWVMIDPDSHRKAEQNPGISRDPSRVVASPSVLLLTDPQLLPSPPARPAPKAKSSKGLSPGPQLPIQGLWDPRTFQK